jgi:hypothetical protein
MLVARRLALGLLALCVYVPAAQAALHQRLTSGILGMEFDYIVVGCTFFRDLVTHR